MILSNESPSCGDSQESALLVELEHGQVDLDHLAVSVGHVC